MAPEEGPPAEKNGSEVDGVADTVGGAWVAASMDAEAETAIAPDAAAGLGAAVVAGRGASNISLKDGKSDMIVG
jgi:hypothetical protein